MTVVTRVPEHEVDHPSEHLVQNLATAVEGALWGYDPLRQTNAWLSVTEERPGVVRLRGVVRGHLMKGVASRLAEGVPGVSEVINGLVADPEIESAVAIALATDPDVDLMTDQIEVDSVLGTVYLGGIAAAEALEDAETARDRATELARAVPGVRNVFNRIRAIEGSIEEADLSADEEEEAGLTPEEEAIQERLKVWRERAVAAGKLEAE